MFKTIIKLLKGKHHAGSNENAENVRQQHVCSGIHRFASKREQAISDCSRVRLLAKALQDQRSRASDCSPGDQVRELTEIAKAAGLWIDYNQVAALGALVSKRTGESEVYWNRAESSFYKIKSPEAKRPLKHTCETDWVYEHIIHNILFPECAYELIGVTAKIREIRVVLKQQAVKTESFPTLPMIESALASRGLVKEDRFFYGDGVVSVTDVGEHGDNVLLGDDGQVYFIDPLIRLHKAAEDVIEFLTGFNPMRELSEQPINATSHPNAAAGIHIFDSLHTDWGGAGSASEIADSIRSARHTNRQSELW